MSAMEKSDLPEVAEKRANKAASTGSSIRPIETGKLSSMVVPAALLKATRRPAGQ
jgi:hypothetical protein